MSEVDVETLYFLFNFIQLSFLGGAMVTLVLINRKLNRLLKAKEKDHAITGKSTARNYPI